MKLVIVESPTKARTLAKFLPSEYKVEASMGHVRDLPQKGGGMAIDIDNDFAPSYEVIGNKKKVVSELKKLAQAASEIYLAPDPDREGEAIAYHVQYLLENARPKVPTSKFKRVTFHEITKGAIEEAMKHPGKVDVKLVNSQQARRVLDRLVGYTLSPVLWKKVRRGLSAGRVQSVAVRLIVEKEAEIKVFVPDEYWQIFADLQSAKQQNNKSTEQQEEKIRVELVKIGGKKAVVKNGEQAGKIVADLNKSEYVISDIAKTKQTSSPNPPYTTSLLQRAASNNFGWSAKQTMTIAQQLYERGYITYHRTDSYNLSQDVIGAAREYLAKKYGSQYVPDKARFYKTKSKSAQEAHEAIRPTDVTVTSEQIEGGKITARHQKLYDLIRSRLLQCQMTDAVFDKTRITVNAKTNQRTNKPTKQQTNKTTDEQTSAYELVAEGKVMIFDGYLKLGKSTEDVELPSLTSGQKLDLEKVLSEQKFTNPPARYTEAGLIKELEKRGIGRPSTYASIISTIQDRAYVVKEEKSFVPTAIGTAVTEFLTKNFEKVMAYEFTAKMEDDLDEVAAGKKEWVKVVKIFWDPFVKKTSQVEETGERVKVPTESTGEKCPDCKEGEVVIRTGRFGKFYSCSTYPTCKYTKQYKEYAEGHVCPDCGGKVVVKKSKKGKFYGCENYPKCKWATWKLPKKD